MRLIFIIINFLLLIPTYSLDIVYLKNDDKISGSIIEMSKTILVIKTEYGTLNIDRKFIKKAAISGAALVCAGGCGGGRGGRVFL